MSVILCDSCRFAIFESSKCVTHHLSDTMEALPVEIEGLLEHDFVLFCPLVGKWGEIWQIQHRFLQVVFVPKNCKKRMLVIAKSHVEIVNSPEEHS